jgi:formylglycine-generating enzyme required for sulfatase activity
MSRTVHFALIAVVVAGCSNNGPDVESLPTLQPTSGGEMLLIPAGTFTMGDSAISTDAPPHQVSLSAFYIDKYLVTQELYEKVMGLNPSKHKNAKNPVERTQWTEAVRFCNKCSELDGLTPCYDLSSWECNFDANGYRLPTEAEWEYASRAGNGGKYCFGDAESDLPQYAAQGKPQSVGQKRPNYWGLYDVHGNVWQWCNDRYSDTYYSESPAENPRGPATGDKRVLRGGAADSPAEKCRVAYRHKEVPRYGDACFGVDYYGIRRVRKPGNSDTPTTVAKGSPIPEPDKKPDKPTPVVTPSSSGKLDVAALKGTIVFVSDRSGVMKIWSMRANGKDAKQLTKGSDADADPRFSPDGKRILYTTQRGRSLEIWLMNRDGSEAKFVTKGSQGSWSPDGQSIVFIQDNQTYIRDLTSGKETRVTPKEWERCGVPAFSPDGKHFAVASRHLSEIGIFVLSVDGKEIRQLKAEEACCTPYWSKDGKKLLCQTVQGHIHQVGADGKNWEQMTFGADVQHDARYSPDEKMILFCRAPAPEGPWQICVKRVDGDEDEFVPLTREGSNLLPDWHADE